MKCLLINRLKEFFLCKSRENKRGFMNLLRVVSKLWKHFLRNLVVGMDQVVLCTVRLSENLYHGP